MNYNNWLRVCESTDKEQPLMSASDVHKEAVKLIKDFQKEHFLGLYLNTKNKIIHSEIISMGTLNATIIHAREVFKPAFIHSAHSLIVVHNHPSGDVAPSIEDNDITKKLSASGDILNIKLLDHIIIGNEQFYSYAEQGGF